MTISTVIVGLYVVLLFVISWASRKLTTGKSENYVLAGLTLAALWAADVSTACNLLLSSGTLFSQDI